MIKRIASLTFLLIIFTITLSAQTSIQKAQAMFIYNFSRLIEWPGASSGNFVIGVFGSPELAAELREYTTGKKAGSQAIAIEEFRAASDISNCEILFVTYGKTRDLPEVSSKIGGNPTLLVTEKRGAIEDGAALNFLIVGNSLKFEIKAGNATSKGLKLSSKLQEMAVESY